MLYASNVFVTIPGFSSAFVPTGISRIGLDVDVREFTTSLDAEYQLYGPAQATVPDVKLMLPDTLRAAAKGWFLDAASGKLLRRDVLVELRDGMGHIRMKVTLNDCFPVAYDNDNVLLQLRVDYLTVQSLATFPQADGFDDIELPIEATHLIETSGAGSTANNYAIQVSGGAQRIQVTETELGGDRFGGTTIGHKTVDTLSMRLVSAGAFVATWINDTAGGLPWKRVVEVSEVAGGPLRIFYDAFPTRVTFLNPLLVLNNGMAPAVVDIAIKPIRVELK